MKEIIIKVNGKIGHKIKKLREHNFYFCTTCKEVVKNDGNLLEGSEFHGIN